MPMHVKTESEATTISMSSSPSRTPDYSHNRHHHHHSTSDPDAKTTSQRRHPSSCSSSAEEKVKVFPYGDGMQRRFILEEGSRAADEEDMEDDERSRRRRRILWMLAFVVGFLVVFFFLALVVWGASRSQRPQITVKSIRFEKMAVQAGTDATGVPTDMATINSTVQLTFRNTASMFGLHVSATPLTLYYSQKLPLAKGITQGFYQRRKTQRDLAVVVSGDRVPAYGSAASLGVGPKGVNANLPVALGLGFTVRSRGYTMGRLVRRTFHTTVRCSVPFDPRIRLPVVIPLNSTLCT